MTCLVLKTALLAAVSLLVAGVGWAGQKPHWANSTKPTSINTTGHTNAPDPAGAVIYIIRDAINFLIINAEVVLDFTFCTDIRLSQTISGTTTTTTCASKSVTGTTDELGRIVINVVAGGNGSLPPRNDFACVIVRVNSVPFPHIPAASFDRDGLNGVGSGDLALVIWDFINHPTAGRSDFDNSGTVSAADLSILTQVFIQGSSALSGAPYCP